MKNLEVGGIYLSDGKAVLVFGIVDFLIQGSNYATGIGVSLTSGKIEDVSHKCVRLKEFSNLTPLELENVSRYYTVLNVLTSNKKVITVSGKARSGKDTVGTQIIREVPNFTRTALGDPIKQVRDLLYGKPVDKDRPSLIMIGQGLRKEDPHVWIKAWLRHAIDLISRDFSTRLVVTDVRQPNEFSFFSSMGALTIRVDADESKRREILVKEDGAGALDNKLLNDETESHVFETDIQFYNDYTQAFYESLEDFIENL